MTGYVIFVSGVGYNQNQAMPPRLVVEYGMRVQYELPVGSSHLDDLRRQVPPETCSRLEMKGLSDTGAPLPYPTTYPDQRAYMPTVPFV